MLGYPRIVFDEAACEFGHELIERITAQGFVVVPLEEFLLVHRDAKSDLWGHLDTQGVSSAIAKVPLPLYRLALRQWNPMPDNPYVAKRSPQTPLSESEILLAEILHVRDQDKVEPCPPETLEQSESTPQRT